MQQNYPNVQLRAKIAMKILKKLGSWFTIYYMNKEEKEMKTL